MDFSEHISNSGGLQKFGACKRLITVAGIHTPDETEHRRETSVEIEAKRRAGELGVAKRSGTKLLQIRKRQWVAGRKVRFEIPPLSMNGGFLGTAHGQVTLIV